MAEFNAQEWKAALTALGWGLIGGWLYGLLWLRRRPQPIVAQPQHQCLGTVVRCVPRESRIEAGRDEYGQGRYQRAQGTDVLMRCTCGKWWTAWMPGTWTTDDFKRTEPVDMDQAISALTEKKEKP